MYVGCSTAVGGRLPCGWLSPLYTDRRQKTLPQVHLLRTRNTNLMSKNLRTESSTLFPSPQIIAVCSPTEAGPWVKVSSACQVHVPADAARLGSRFVVVGTKT